VFVRRVLRIRERPAGLSGAAAYSAFQRSMLISAIRCTLTYVVFPFVLPAVGFATGVGPLVGVVIGVVAITCDVLSIRRFFAVDHRWRWHFSAIALSVIGLLSVLLVQDIVHLVT
jgi:ABC-type iron transport system FetAB permease component